MVTLYNTIAWTTTLANASFSAKMHHYVTFTMINQTALCNSYQQMKWIREKIDIVAFTETSCGWMQYSEISLFTCGNKKNKSQQKI